MSTEALAVPTLLLPETNPVIAELEAAYAVPGFDKEKIGVNVLFKPMSLEDAADHLTHGQVDIVIAGATHGSPEVLRTAIHGINKVIDPEIRLPITSFFIMEKEGEEPLYFADCAVQDKPDVNDRVTIAEQTCESVRHLGVEPVVAFLSLSTFGSAGHLEGVQQIKQSAEKFQEKHPDIITYGEIQVDAALNPDIFKKKAEGKGIELVGGKMPNVFIFPDGQSGNMAYKFVEQLAGRTAIGPLLNGVKRDWHDLSRGVQLDALIRNIEVAGQLWRARQLSDHYKMA